MRSGLRAETQENETADPGAAESIEFVILRNAQAEVDHGGTSLDYDNNKESGLPRSTASHRDTVMIDIGSFLSRTCQGVSRRTFLRAGFVAPFALGLAGQGIAKAAE